MKTKEEKRIIQYLLDKGTITRLEIDAVDVRLESFLDIMGKLCYRRLVETKQRGINTKSANPLVINVYSLTEAGKRLYESSLSIQVPKIKKRVVV